MSDPSSIAFARCFALLALAGTSTLACGKSETPTVTPQAARVISVGPTGIRLGIELEVNNPNSFSLAVRRVDGTLEVANGVPVGSGHSEPSSSLPAKSRTPVASELDVAWTNLPALAPFALNPQPLPWRFRGLATVGGERLNVSLPFELHGELTPADVVSIVTRPAAAPSLP